MILIFLLCLVTADTSATDTSARSDIHSIIRGKYKNINGIILVINPQTGKKLVQIDPQNLYTEKFTPGSIIKTFLVITGMEDNSINPDKIVECKKGKCWNPQSHGKVNLVQALGYSCNYYFRETAKNVDFEEFSNVIKEFGVTEEIIAGEKLTGQERRYIMVGLSTKLKTSPGKMLYAYSAVFNSGYIFDNGVVLQRRETSPHIVEILKKGMHEGTLYGTSSKARREAGLEKFFSKTGTSPYNYKGKTDSTRTHAWFIGFYPEKNPNIGALVFLLNGTGSEDAAKTGGDVIRTLIGNNKNPRLPVGTMERKNLLFARGHNKIYASGWLFSTNETDGENLTFIDELNPFSEWQVSPDGNIKRKSGILPKDIVLRSCRRFSVVPTLRINAPEFNELNTKDRRNVFINNIRKKILDGSCAGVEFNIESDWKRTVFVDEKLLVDFLEELKSALGRNKTISLCVDRGMIQNFSPNAWKKIDILVAQYKAVLYDYNKNTKKACSGAPVPEIKNDLFRLVRFVPHKKIILGVPTHGYFWEGQENGSYQYKGSLWYEKGIHIAKYTSTPVREYIERIERKELKIPANAKTINWDDYSMTPYIAFYENGKRHEIWYENAESLEFKYRHIVKSFGLKGIAIWRFGMEDTEIWNLEQ